MQNNNVIELVLRLKDQASQALAGFRGQLATLKGGVAAALGGVGIGLAMRALVRNVVEAEQAALKLDVAYRNMGGGLGRTRAQLDELATSLQNTTTASDDTVKEAQALLLTFDQVRGDAFERTIRVANDMSVALGGDLVSATQRLGRALQDPAAALGLLARSGVKLSDDLEQVIKSLASTGRTAQAQEILLSELERRFGGVATAARNTLGGALAGLKNQVSDLFEGDTSSFGGAVTQLNRLSASLSDPSVKAGFDTLIAGLATATSKAIEYSAAIAEGARVTGEFFAKLRTGNFRGTEPLDIEFATLDRLKAARADISEGRRPFMSTAKSREELAKLDTAIAASQKRIQALQVENTRGSVYNPAKAVAATTAATASGDEIARAKAEMAAKAAQEAAAKLVALRSQALEGVAGVFEEWAQSEARVKQALAAGAISQAEATASINALRDQVRASVLPKGDLIGAELAEQIALIQGALERGSVSADEAASAIARFRKEAAAEVGPSWLKAAAAWESLEARISAAAKAGVLTAAQARAALDELVKDNLTEVEITAKRITVEPAALSEFARSMQEHIQRTFADAFMSIGTDDGKTVARNFLDGFKRIVAEGAAHDLAKLLKLDTLGKGGGSVLGSIFGKRTAAVPGAAGGAQGGGCATECASNVVGQVSTTLGGGLKDLIATVVEPIKMLTSGAWKFISGALSKLWDFIKGALEAIRALVASAGSGSSSGGFVSAIVSGIGSLFGASAGGGMMPANKPRWVGEEGPELILPGSSMMAVNQRQLAYAGGGGSLEYKPSYSITINGAKDDRAMAQQLMVYVERQDQKNKVEIMEMLRRNGYGRMTR